MSTLDETRARRYLLGQMSDEETAALEEEYFASSEALERVWEAENDLVDAFVAGELQTAERAAFESHYLSSALHRDRVASARALRAVTERVTSQPARRPAGLWAGWLALAAGLVLMAWWLTRPAPTSQSVVQNPPPPTASTPASLENAHAQVSPAPRPLVAAFALSPVLLRGGQATPVLRVPAGASEVALTLEGERPEGVPPRAPFDFVVTTVEGARVTNGRVAAGSKGLGVAHVGADRLPPGDYILTLTQRDAADTTPVARYFFRIPAR